MVEVFGDTVEQGDDDLIAFVHLRVGSDVGQHQVSGHVILPHSLHRLLQVVNCKHSRVLLQQSFDTANQRFRGSAEFFNDSIVIRIGRN